MELDRSILFTINHFKCEYRALSEADVTQEYVDGLIKQTKYIENIPDKVSISNQQKYIREKLLSKADTINGLFIGNRLVGTAGIQSSVIFFNYVKVPDESMATLGILIFDMNYKRMGLGKALVWASVYLTYNCLKTKWFGAGMANENMPSLKSFLSCGFKQVDEVDQSLRVLLKFSELKKPNFIKNLSIR